MNRPLKIVGIVVALIILVVIALPFVINVNDYRPRIESELSTALGRPVHVGNLHLSVFSGSVSADDLSIADDPAFSKDAFIRAKALDVGVEVMPLIFSKVLNITNLTLDTPQVSLVKSASGKWNFSSLGNSSKKSSSSSSNPNLSVGKLHVKNGVVTVTDANSPAKPHTYQNVDIAVQDFSLTSQFPFTLSADLPGGGDLKLNGKAGPVDANDASLTPLEAEIKVSRFDLAASGLVEPSSGLGAVADFTGTMNSDGHQLKSSGTVTADKLKLSPKGSPAGKQVQALYAIEHDLQKQTGQLTQGEVTVGKAVARLSGTYKIEPAATILNMKLNADNMPVDDLEPMLPALGVTLPSGSSLKGGTLSANLGMTGPVDKLVITGPLHLANSKLSGFSLGSKLAAISKFGGSANTGSDTLIENFSTNAHMAPNGISTDNVNLTVPSLGVLTGAGTISPGGDLNYKMAAKLSGSVATGLSQIAGLQGGSGSIPFMIQGTTSNPKFVPDVKGLLGNQLKSGIPGIPGQNTQGGAVVNSLSGLFGKKKPK
ncbi:MAG: AsmA family protein [Acidobacteriaceae bacterium]